MTARSKVTHEHVQFDLDILIDYQVEIDGERNVTHVMVHRHSGVGTSHASYETCRENLIDAVRVAYGDTRFVGAG